MPTSTHSTTVSGLLPILEKTLHQQSFFLERLHGEDTHHYYYALHMYIIYDHRVRRLASGLLAAAAAVRLAA